MQKKELISKESFSDFEQKTWIFSRRWGRIFAPEKKIESEDELNYYLKKEIKKKWIFNFLFWGVKTNILNVGDNNSWNINFKL